LDDLEGPILGGKHDGIERVVSELELRVRQRGNTRLELVRNAIVAEDDTQHPGGARRVAV
jgi:hypothetical protein